MMEEQGSKHSDHRGLILKLKLEFRVFAITLLKHLILNLI